MSAVRSTSSLRQRKGVPNAQDLSNNLFSDEDSVYWITPPARASSCSILSPFSDGIWRFFRILSAVLGTNIMEPWEFVFLVTVYTLIFICLIVAARSFPAYAKLAHRRLHYYITGN
ncbi:hypothetical protein MVES1_000414 [Malassezia vespertilionis]|uniref:Uncharacterized protein n=1 Tax=Malassezia vespertilionis TaxID=2020962 RepID=A0A2N1JGT4_9BASI|nr:uncharacterized protein MVES1_000414 [Malassezia vespertilionis]PKI85748.1 hypothetical protein MVES_000387 [Malassezia vespertilionis]WFD05088.1 hypothetical protein MVES1_000414 [Malassezia vespertilionis]